MSKSTVHIRTESSVVIEMDWPLNQWQQAKLDKGETWCVDPETGKRIPAPNAAAEADDAAVFIGGGPVVAEGGEATPAPAGDPVALTRPANNAKKAEWVEWAVKVGGADRALAEALTIPDLIDMYGDARPPVADE